MSMDKVAVKKFVKTWCGRGYEKGESQPFWLALFRDVLEVERPEEFIIFEEQVHLDHTSFIDGYIPATKVLIEQKSLGKDLQRPIKQSDGTYLTPFQQAKRYILELPVDKHPRWVVVSNFAEFHVYDMNKPQSEPEHILLKDLERDYYRLNFLVNVGDEHVKREMEISLSAGKLVSLLYDELLKQYHNPQDPQTLRSLNILCVRLVFCFYADDAELFGRKFMFCDYLKQFPALHMRKALVDLFEVLNTKIEERDPYLLPDLAAFPYVNGGLFAQKDVEIPIFTEEIRDLILEKASLDLDWSQISPTIFGAVFESTLNPVTRRKGGMHYTSIENIHKVIDPLFLNDLKEELAEIKALKTIGTRKNRLKKFQEKLSNLTFLDPACGSGNFLTETYLSLRRLENEVLETLNQSQMEFSTEEIAPIQVRINQFYGIEINDFAVT
ncbi:SAM-dependent DNA methyltransferase, partial [bacterium]|nr:SAM-dependent DNA methyltransferase [bacterium]